MATIALGFNISASATGMAQGVNAAAVELEKLGYAAKKTAADVGTLKTLSIGQAFIGGIQNVYSTFSGLANAQFQAVESTSNLSRELGINYGQLQELQLAAQLAGVSTETLGKAFTKAQITISKAAAGGKEAVQALSSIGLSAQDFQGLSSSEQFTLIASSISNIADPATRAAAAVAIFGKSGAELLPVFRELGGNLQQSQELLAKFGGGLSENDITSVLSLGDAWDKVGAAISLFAQKILAALAPALTEVANSIVNWLAELSKSDTVVSTAESVVAGFVSVLQLGYNVATGLAPVFTAIGQAISFIAENGRGAAVGFGLAAAALGIYKVAAIASTIATVGLAASVRALLASTGVGLLVTLFGTLAGAAVEWGLSTATAGKDAASGVAKAAAAADSAAGSANSMGQSTAENVRASFEVVNDESKKAEEAAKKAEEATKRAAEAARREADSAISRLVTDQQFGGDSQRYAAAQAVKAIEEDIRNTEAEIAAARESGDQAAVNAGTQRLSQLDQAMAREKDIASGARKAAEERAKLEAKLGQQRMKLEEQIANAFKKPTDPLKLEDVRSVSGYEALQRFSQDQSQDPALDEYRKQLKELQQIRRQLANGAAQTETVDIL